MSESVKTVTLFDGDPSSATPVEKTIRVPRDGRGWAWLHIKIAAHASDTTSVAIKGRLDTNGTLLALKQSDQSTAASLTQSGGAANESIQSVQLVPNMKVVLTGTSTSGASVKVWLEAAAEPARADS
jgi:hypothetical protein